MSKDYQEYKEGKKLHPLTLLYKAIASSPGILIPFYFAFFQGDKEEWLFIIISIIVVIFTIPNIILSYYYFTFYILPEEIIIHSGVFSRKQRNISIERIQNVNIEQNVLMRLFGLAKVQIETAGDIQTEGLLEFVSKDDAEEIKELIRTYQYKKIKHEEGEAPKESEIPVEKPDSDENSEDEETEENEPAPFKKPHENVLFKLSLKNTLYYGALRVRPIILMIVAWWLSFAVQFDFMPKPQDMGLIDFFTDFTIINPLILTGMILGAVISFVVLTVILDMLLTLNQFYGFTLTNEGNTLYTSYGLLTKRHNTIPLKKLQTISITTNPLKEKFNYFRLTIQTSGLCQRGGNSEAAIPFAKENILINIAKKILSFEFPEKLNPVSPKTIRRAFFRYSMILLLFAGIYFLIALDSTSQLLHYLWILLFLPLFYFAAVLRYRFRGYALVDDKIIIKEGFWFRKKTIIPIKKIQTLNIKETIFQRRLHLATLNIDTASTSALADANIIDIDRDDAHEIMDELSREFHKLK